MRKSKNKAKGQNQEAQNLKSQEAQGNTFTKQGCMTQEIRRSGKDRRKNTVFNALGRMKHIKQLQEQENTVSKAKDADTKTLNLAVMSSFLLYLVKQLCENPFQFLSVSFF